MRNLWAKAKDALANHYAEAIMLVAVLAVIGIMTGLHGHD